MPVIYIIGAGQLGSRHLQALQSVQTPLDIHVVDPFAASLTTAKERFEAVEDGKKRHAISFTTNLQDLSNNKSIDIAIIATNADVRKDVVTKLLEEASVRNLILEKLLFTKKEDYREIQNVLQEKKCNAWVNCSMRTMPFYQSVKKDFQSKPVTCFISGSQFGLVTNAIHYLDYISYLTDCDSFTLDTSYLDPQIIPSKRNGFFELTGTLIAKFSNQSLLIISCASSGDSPVQIELYNTEHRYISRESEKKAWISHQTNTWKWAEMNAEIPYQSQMTADVVNKILLSGSCELTPFNTSVKTHLSLLEPLRVFINSLGEKTFDYYPFT